MLAAFHGGGACKNVRYIKRENYLQIFHVYLEPISFLKESNAVAFLLEDSVTEISVGWGGAVAPLLP